MHRDGGAFVDRINGQFVKVVSRLLHQTAKLLLHDSRKGATCVSCDIVDGRVAAFGQSVDGLLELSQLALFFGQGNFTIFDRFEGGELLFEGGFELLLDLSEAGCVGFGQNLLLLC